MPRYTVLVTRDATESARVTIYAPDPLEAERRAVLFAAENPHVEQAPDDGNFHKPYICDPGNCAELVPDNAGDNRTHTVRT